jgi:hypothetical protein
MKLKNVRNVFFLILRIALLASVAIDILLVYFGTTGENSGKEISNYSRNLESALFALLTFALSFGSEVIEQGNKIDIPDILEIIIVLFIYAGLFLSSQFNLYYTFWWWDDLLHTLSGVILGFIGFIVVYKINYRYSMDINPLLIALFSFAFAISLGVLWEIGEFTLDVITGSAHQKWDLEDNEELMGKPYQGSGLRDTMSDLIIDTVGALITSIITYFMYKTQKKKVLASMEKMVK